VEVTLRAAGDEDRAEIVDLCRRSLGWEPGDPNEGFFAWKHDHNAAGPSPMWVAEGDDGRIVGVRCFMRWRFRDPATAAPLHAVRAVDTATHPDARGLGIFRRLTLGALGPLTEAGTSFVFNTPNEQSRPGYLKMGWEVVGTVPLAVRPTRLPPLRSRTQAWSGSQKWGVPTTAGWSPEEAFADAGAVTRLLAALPRPGGIATDRDVDFLRWRYGFAPLGYRVFPAGDSIEDGALVFRLRRRGSRLDATICDDLLPPGARRGRVHRRLAAATGAHLLIRSQSRPVAVDGFVRVQRLGPLLTWRPLARPGVPALADLDLTYGDLELF